jgi:type IV secretion system protein TrbE
MLNLPEFRGTTTRLADFLPWAALAGNGVVLNKDGSWTPPRTMALRAIF